MQYNSGELKNQFVSLGLKNHKQGTITEHACVRLVVTVCDKVQKRQELVLPPVWRASCSSGETLEIIKESGDVNEVQIKRSNPQEWTASTKQIT